MKFKNCRGNIIYCILILIFVISSGFILKKASVNSHMNFTPFILYRIYFVVLFLFGVMLGLECLFYEKSKNGKWKLNLWKLTILGIPCLVIFIWIWFPLVFEIVIIKANFLYILNHNIFFNLSIILWGWVLTTSIYKED